MKPATMSLISTPVASARTLATLPALAEKSLIFLAIFYLSGCASETYMKPPTYLERDNLRLMKENIFLKRELYIKNGQLHDKDRLINRMGSELSTAKERATYLENMTKEDKPRENRDEKPNEDKYETVCGRKTCFEIPSTGI